MTSGLVKKFDLGAIFDFLDFQKGAFWTTFSAERAPKEHEAELREASGERAYYALEHGEVRVTGPTVCLAMGFFEALAETQQTLSQSR